MAVPCINCSLPKSAPWFCLSMIARSEQWPGHQVMCTSSLCVLDGNCDAVLSSGVSLLFANS